MSTRIRSILSSQAKLAPCTFLLMAALGCSPRGELPPDLGSADLSSLLAAADIEGSAVVVKIDWRSLADQRLVEDLATQTTAKDVPILLVRDDLTATLLPTRRDVALEPGMVLPGVMAPSSAHAVEARGRAVLSTTAAPEYIRRMQAFLASGESLAVYQEELIEELRLRLIDMLPPGHGPLVAFFDRVCSSCTDGQLALRLLSEPSPAGPRVNVFVRSDVRLLTPNEHGSALHQYDGNSPPFESLLLDLRLLDVTMPLLWNGDARVSESSLNETLSLQ